MTEPSDRPLLALSTTDDEESAGALARRLLEERLAACVNIVPGIRSMYWWQGRIEEGAECLLVIKTTWARWPALKARLPQLHAYDVPELIATELTDGLEPYLRWLVSEVQGEKR